MFRDIQLLVQNHYNQIAVNRTVLLLVTSLTVSCASQSSQMLPPPATVPTTVHTDKGTDGRTYEVGDKLELIVEEDSSFNGQYDVRPEGYVLIPKLGRVPVQGLTRAAAEKRVKEFLQRSQLTTATVFVELISARQSSNGSFASSGQSRIKVFITGKVDKPGLHQIPTTDGRLPGVYEVLLASGGTSNFGNLSKVKIIRLDASGMRQSQIVDVNKIQQGVTLDIPVGDGDIIEVPEKVFGF